jgi:hypothetical protein
MESFSHLSMYMLSWLMYPIHFLQSSPKYGRKHPMMIARVIGYQAPT